MKRKKGISLIVLVITIIVIVILATSVIITLVKNNPIDNAKKSILLNDLSLFKEELELFKSNKEMESNGKFDPESLEANRFDISYNTKPEGEKGNINTILSTLSRN